MIDGSEKRNRQLAYELQNSLVKNEEYSLKQNVFLVQLQTLLEVIKIFVQFHCLGSYRNDFVSSLLGLLSLNILVLPCGTKFLRVLIFAIFPAIQKNTFPQINITTNIFPAKIYSRVNILRLKFATQKYSTKKSCLFKSRLSFVQKQNGIQRNTRV